MPWKGKGKIKGKGKGGKSRVSRNVVLYRKRTIGTNSYTDFGKLRGPFHNYVKGDPFAPAILRRLHYTESYSFTSGVAGVLGSEVILNVNSIYDPYQSGVGHQPYGHDQLASLYRKYKVTGVKIKWEWTNPSADGMVVCMTAGSQGMSYSLSGLSHDQVSELPMSVTKTINDSGSQKAIVSQYFPMHVLLGITKMQFDSDTLSYSAAFGANPSAIPKVRFSAGSITGASGDTIQCKVSMIFYTMCYDRITQQQS